MSTEDMGGGIVGNGLGALLDSEIKRLENRLEVYDSTGKIRLSEDCDGIACRDETIRLIDKRHEGDKKVVAASEACARKHQERAADLLSELAAANAREKKAFMYAIWIDPDCWMSENDELDPEQAWQQYRCQDETDWKVVSEEEAAKIDAAVLGRRTP